MTGQFRLGLLLLLWGSHGTTQASRAVIYDIPKHLQVQSLDISSIDVVSSHGRELTGEGAEAEAARRDRSSKNGPTTVQLALRFIYLMLIFSPVILTSGLAMISSIFRTHAWFWMLSNSIAVSGAAFIKWGQWASTRPDIFPSDLCSALSVLQANAPEHSWSFTKSQILFELGKPTDRVFEWIDPKPIASGSIAQVYRARLNGADVAVKVRHPHGM